MLTAFGSFLRHAQMPQPQPPGPSSTTSKCSRAGLATGRLRRSRARRARTSCGHSFASTSSTRAWWRTARRSGPRSRTWRPSTTGNDTLLHRDIELDDTSPLNVGFYTVKPCGYPVRLSTAPPTYQNYGWEVPSELAAIRVEYDRLANDTTVLKRSCQKLRADAAQAVDTAVDNERWITTYGPGGREAVSSLAATPTRTRSSGTRARWPSSSRA